MQIIVYLLVFLPFAVATLVLPFVRRRPKAESAVIITSSAVLLALSILLYFLPDIVTSLPVFGGMGLRFSHDGSMRTLLTILAALMWLAESLYAPEYFKGSDDNPRFYTFYLLTQGALFGVFLSADLFTLFVFFEIMSVSSYVWIAQTETTDAVAVSKTYLYMSLIGGMVMLMGMFLLYHSCGSTDWGVIASSAISAPIRYTAGGCLLFGFGVKAGMFPLHVWLPVSHPVAPAPASALLSGILLKSGIFGILLTTQALFPGDRFWGNFLMVIAVITMLLGGVLGIFSTDLKRTLACSSMSQIGFILFGVSCISLLGDEIVVPAAGVTLHLVNHALIKLVLFTLSGIIYRNLHSITYNRIRGYGKDKPGLLVPFLLCACSISGIPGFSGYISKILLHEGIVEYYTHQALSGQIITFYKGMEALFLIAGGCTLAYMLKLFYVIFIAAPPEKAAKAAKEKKAVSADAKKGAAAKGKTAKKPYTRKLTLVLLLIPSIAMPVFGIFAWNTMERIFDRAAEFFFVNEKIMVEYFSYECVSGALISIGLGILIFVLNLLLIRGNRKEGRDVYLSRWSRLSRSLNLEYRLYRPMLKGLAAIGTVIARALETVSTALCYGIINLIFHGAKRRIRPAEDPYFGKYGKEITHSVVSGSFSLDLLLAGLGIAGILVFIVVRIFL